jgi:hypothetical protein
MNDISVFEVFVSSIDTLCVEVMSINAVFKCSCETQWCMRLFHCIRRLWLLQVSELRGGL